MTIFDSSTVYDKYVHFLLVDWYWSLMMSHPNQPQAPFTSSVVFVILWQRKGFQAGQKSQPAQSADSQLIAVPSPDTAFTVFRLSASTWGKSFFLLGNWIWSQIELTVTFPFFCSGQARHLQGLRVGVGGDRGRGVSPSNWFSAQVFVESDFLIPLHHPPLEL